MVNEKIKVFFMALQEKEVARIEIRYDGAGDSGAIDSSFFYDAKANEIDLPEYNAEAESIGYHILERYYDVDWYNNDGGHGSIFIDISDQTWNIDGYYRTIESVEAPESGDLQSVMESYKDND